MNTCPLLLHSVNAGFPSPADDFVEMQLNIHDHLIKHPCASFFLRVGGESMKGAGIYPGDILFTGSPPGVSEVHPGDVMRCNCDLIGEMEVTVRAAE